MYLKLSVFWAFSAQNILLISFSQGSNQNDNSSHQLHQIISEDGEPLIVAADSYVGEDSVEALEAQVCMHIFNNIASLSSAIQMCQVPDPLNFKPPTKSNPCLPRHRGGNILVWQIGLWSTEAKMWGIVLKTGWHWGGDSSVANDPFGALGSTPSHTCFPPAWCSAGGDCLIPQFLWD
jgi:hypothetical protein